ncbi:MAG: serine/threonine-protein kinase [Nannocystaceae bacterium]
MTPAAGRADARSSTTDSRPSNTPRPEDPRLATPIDETHVGPESALRTPPPLDESRVSPSMSTPRPGVTTAAELEATRLRTAGPPTSGPAEEGAPPPRIGRFLVLRQLGRGGMGVVYAGFDNHLDRKVAIKLLRDQSSDGDDRLLREAQALARLSHPNVVGVYEVGRALDSVYVAMEFVVGATLRAWLAERRRTQAEILEVFLQAGRGLAAAHAVGLVHRDFKPDNVMVGEDGRVRVFDFGLARSVADGEPLRTGRSKKSSMAPLSSGSFLSTDMTIAGTILGTPAYMAPEQFLAIPTDPRTDIFSYCVTLHEALYDRRPFVGATFDELRDAVCRGDVIPAPRETGVPSWLRARLLRGLAPSPDDRWQTLDALLVALTDDPIARRRRWLKGFALVAMIAAIAVATPLGIGALRSRMEAKAREEAAARRWEAIADRALPEAGAAAKDEAQADALFDAFASAAEVRGTRALTEAWLARGRRAYEAGDAERAMEAFATAYTGAPNVALERSTLLAIAGVFRARWDMRALAPLVDFLGDAREPRAAAAVDPTIDPLRVDVALDRHDFAAAADLLDRLGDDAPAHLRGLQPALRRLTRAVDLGVTNDVHAALVDLDGDGRDELLDAYLPGEEADEQATIRVRSLDGAPPRVLATYPQRPGYRAVQDAPAIFIRATQDPSEGRDKVWSLYEVAGDGLHERWRGALPNAVLQSVAADLDGDGAREVYVSLAAYRRGLFRVDPSTTGEPDLREPTIVDETVDRLGSDVNALAITDLDGDGRPELVAGLGPWRAYDVRVLRWADGRYETVAHAEIGAAKRLTSAVGAGGERWLVVATNGRTRNRQLYPDPPHLAAPAGLHLLRLDGDRLVAGPTFAVGADELAVGDLDGDGLDDLIYSSHQSEDAADGRLFARRQGPDGDFVEVSLGEGRLVGVTQADDDPEVELVIRQGEQLWLLGHGPKDTPVMRPASPPPRRPPPGLGDPALVAHWERADRLAILGLEALAGRSLLDLAHLVDAPIRRSSILERAADLFARAGDRRRAIEVLGELAGDPAVVAAGRRLSATHHAAIGEYVAAEAALREGGGVAADPGAFIPFTVPELALIGEPALRTRITFDRPLDPGWSFLHPAAIRRDHIAGRLHIDAAELDEPWAVLPLVWDGGPILVQVDVEVEAMEYGSSFTVELMADDKRMSWGTLNVFGGAGHLVRQLSAPGGPVAELGDGDAERRQRLRLTLACSPATGRQAVVFGVDGALHRREAEIQADLATSALTLRLAPTVDNPEALGQVRIRVEAIELIGVRPASGDDDLRRRGARALVEGGFDEAARLLAEASAGGERRTELALELALAYAELERWPEARAALAPLAAAESREDVELFGEHLRGRPAIRPLLTELLGARATAVRMMTYGIPARQHTRETFARRLLLDDFAKVRDLEASDPDLDALAVQLLVARASVLREIGDLQEAALDLAAARRLLDGLLGDLSGELSAQVTLPYAREEARLLVARGDHEGARAALERIVAQAIEPDLERSRLSRDPALRGELRPR